MKKAHEQDLREIREYVLSQSARGEVVKSVEKVAEHTLGERRYEIYNVETKRDRWWVITNMTNLYSQRDYPTMDVAFSLHLGLMDRLMERDQPWGSKGCIAAVELERRLKAIAPPPVVSNRRDPQLEDYNKSAFDNGVIDQATWTLVTNLAVTRKRCVHVLDREPEHDEVRDLIDGVEGILRRYPIVEGIKP